MTTDAETPQIVQPVATSADIQAIVARAKTAFAQFQSAQSDARRSINDSRGKATDSSAYTGALLALADLSSLRSDTALALGDLDLMASEAKIQFAPTDNLAKAQAEVLLLLKTQDANLGELWNDFEP